MEKEMTMTEINMKLMLTLQADSILRAGVSRANDGIISIAGVVIGVASATSNIWIIFYQVRPLSSLTLFLWQAANMSLYPLRKKTRKKPLLLKQILLDKDINLQNNPSMLLTYKMVVWNVLLLIQQGLFKESLKEPWLRKIRYRSRICGMPLALSPLLLSLSPHAFDPTFQVIIIPATVFIVALSLLVTGYTMM